LTNLLKLPLNISSQANCSCLKGILCHWINFWWKFTTRSRINALTVHGHCAWCLKHTTVDRTWTLSCHYNLFVRQLNNNVVFSQMYRTKRWNNQHL